MITQIFDNLQHEEVLQCMQVLGHTKIDNYSEEFILKLYENYADRDFMERMFSNDSDFFFQFAKAWPSFLRNNAILNQLTKFKGKNFTT